MALDEKVVNSEVPAKVAYFEGADGQLYQKVSLVDDSGLPSGSSSGIVTPAHTKVSVGVASTTVIAANTSRKSLLIVNDSDTTVYLNLAGDAAVLNEGVRLNSGGSSYEMSAGLGNLVTGAIAGIHGGSGTKLLLITEGT